MKIREKYNACKQRFKNLSLKKKLLLFYTALFLLPLLLISVIIYVEVSQSMTEKIQFSATQGYEQAKSYLEYKILEMIQRTDVVVTSNSLRQQIEEDSELLSDPHNQLAQKEAIRSYLQSVESSTQSIRIKIYITDKLPMLFDGDYIFPLSKAGEALWYQKKGTQKVYFAPGIYLEKEKQDKYVALVRDIPKENNYRERSCVLRMDIGIEELGNILQNATPTEQAVTYLVNRENIVVAVSDRQKLEDLGLSGLSLIHICIKEEPLRVDWRLSRENGPEGGFKEEIVLRVGEELPNLNGPGFFPSYSGTYRYEAYFTCKKEAGRRYQLFLPEASDCVRVVLNGRDCGWLAGFPSRAEITDTLVSGENKLELYVAVTLVWDRKDGASTHLQIPATGITKEPILETYK